MCLTFTSTPLSLFLTTHTHYLSLSSHHLPHSATSLTHSFPRTQIAHTQMQTITHEPIWIASELFSLPEDVKREEKQDKESQRGLRIESEESRRWDTWVVKRHLLKWRSERHRPVGDRGVGGTPDHSLLSLLLSSPPALIPFVSSSILAPFFILTISLAPRTGRACTERR